MQHVGVTARRTTVTLLLAAALLAGAAVPVRAETGPSVVEAQPPLPIADFQLTNQHGQPFRLSQLKGEPVLIFFGFTHCPDACPLAMGRLAALRSATDPAVREARVVFISTDGRRDTPAVLREYLARFPSGFIGLTGDPKDVGRIAARFSAVFFRGRAADSAGNYLVEHSTQIYLLDRDGSLRATFFDAPVDTIARVTAAVARETASSHNAK